MTYMFPTRIPFSQKRHINSDFSNCVSRLFSRNFQNCFNSGEGFDCQGDCSDCVLTDQMDYFDTYGISTDGTELKLTYVLPSEYGGYGARTYLVDGTGTDAEYKMFYLDLENGWEFSFDVDLSRIPVI